MTLCLFLLNLILFFNLVFQPFNVFFNLILYFSWVYISLSALLLINRLCISSHSSRVPTQGRYPLLGQISQLVLKEKDSKQFLVLWVIWCLLQLLKSAIVEQKQPQTTCECMSMCVILSNLIYKNKWGPDLVLGSQFTNTSS